MSPRASHGTTFFAKPCRCEVVGRALARTLLSGPLVMTTSHWFSLPILSAASLQTTVESGRLL
ncbi:MAG TPA: hypothetical protein VG755_26380, partial [Nannocystaceae bacterium]|nr:hypothetical protein [Nannocystaceae bacterium]